MIIITARRPRISFATGISLLTAFCSLLLVVGLVHEPFQVAMSTTSGETVRVKSSNQRITYLEQWGWEVDPTALATQTLLIPTILDDSYVEYMSLQTEQGFPSLSNFCGQQVVQYTYQVSNYPTGEEGVQVNLLCYQHQVIAGEVFSHEEEGFIHGLKRPT